MRNLIAILMTLTLATVMACSHKQESAPEKPMSAKDTVFGDDIRALEKAKGVQDTLNKDKANTDKAIDSATESSNNSATDDSKLPVSTD